MIMTRSLLVSEIFGLTIQGEGRSVGVPCAFLRLGGCNLHCTWCDTPYTWVFDDRHTVLHGAHKRYDPVEELQRLSVEDVINQLRHVQPDEYGLVVISGGEPMLQQDVLADLITRTTYQ